MKKIFCRGNYLEQVLEVLKNGGVVAVPTETVYGFSCDPANQMAVEKIYQIKGMGFQKPLLLLAENLSVVDKYFQMNATEKILAKKYWPGPLNIILQLRKTSSAGAPDKFGLVLKDKKKLKFKRAANESAVRVSSDKLMKQLAKECGGFVSSTSANVTGQKECLSGLAVYRQFKNRKYQPDLILDAGKLVSQKPSTIVQVFNKKIEVIRQGEMKIKI